MQCTQPNPAYSFTPRASREDESPSSADQMPAFSASSFWATKVSSSVTETRRDPAIHRRSTYSPLGNDCELFPPISGYITCDISRDGVGGPSMKALVEMGSAGGPDDSPTDGVTVDERR